MILTLQQALTIIDMIDKKELTSATARKLASTVAVEGGDPRTIAKERDYVRYNPYGGR